MFDHLGQDSTICCDICLYYQSICTRCIKKNNSVRPPSTGVRSGQIALLMGLSGQVEHCGPRRLTYDKQCTFDLILLQCGGCY